MAGGREPRLRESDSLLLSAAEPLLDSSFQLSRSKSAFCDQAKLLALDDVVGRRDVRLQQIDCFAWDWPARCSALHGSALSHLRSIQGKCACRVLGICLGSAVTDDRPPGMRRTRLEISRAACDQLRTLVVDSPSDRVHCRLDPSVLHAGAYA